MTVANAYYLNSVKSTDASTRLSQLRRKLGLSVREMAAEIGVSPAAITMWELGKRDLPGMALKILEIYEESLDGEVAIRNRQAIIRKICANWSSRLLLAFGKGSRGRERDRIKKGIENTLSGVLVHELSQHPVKRNVQVAVFNRIVNAACQTKGLPMKAIQMMTYLNPEMAPAARKALEGIYDLNFPMAPTRVAKILYESFGASPSKLFAEWSPLPFATASIGQVHLARLHSGERVAVKVQYPEIRESLDKDFRVFEFLTDLAKLFNHDLKSVVSGIKSVVLGETDYDQEAGNLESFGELFRGDGKVIIPKVYRRFSNDRVLTMDYIDGQNFASFCHAPERERFLAAQTLAHFATVSSFCSGLINTDAHQANFIFCGGGRVGFVDFGRAVKVDPEGGYAQRELLKAVISGDASAGKRLIPHMPFVKDPATFDSDRFWEFFIRQQGHLRSGPFRFTRSYIAEIMRLTKNDSQQSEMLMTPVLVWAAAMSFGVWELLAGLNVEIDFGRVSLETLKERGLA